MGDLGSVFNAITGDNKNTADQLAKSGYQQYTPGAAPALNMGAYGPDQTTQANAAQINQGQANQFLPGEQALVSQLQSQAQGSGPSLAQAQLRQGTQSNIAAQLAAAAGQRGNQNPGAANYALAQNTAAANQAAAGQAAATRANEQLTSEQGLGQAMGEYGGQQIGLAENQAGLNQGANLQNAQEANQMAEFNTTAAQAGNTAQQAQYQYGTSLAAQEQNAENAAIAGQQLGNQGALNTFATGTVGGGLNSAGGYLQSLNGGGGNGGNGGNNGSAPPADGSGFGDTGDAAGALITHPVRRILGEHDKPEVVVPLDGSEDPHEFLDRMMARQRAGGGTTPGGPVDHETLGRVLAHAVKELG